MFWDADGANPGAGGATPIGTWGVDAYWSVDSNGGAVTAGWTPGELAIFSAGTDAVGTFTVTVSGTQIAKQITFEEGNVTLSGGTLDITNVVQADAATATINSVITNSSDTGLNKEGAGTVTIGAVNTYNGTTTVNAAKLAIAAAAKFFRLRQQ
jgi:autotransporter-associated beta strand protein